MVNEISNGGKEREGKVAKKINPNIAFHFSKGYIYTLEAVVIIAIIIVALGFMFAAPSQQPELEIVNIKHQGFDALEYLDKTGDLRRMVNENDEVELENQLKSLLPKNLKYETNICGSNCSSASAVANDTTVAVNYYIAGYRNTYIGKKVILWMWRKGL